MLSSLLDVNAEVITERKKGWKITGKFKANNLKKIKKEKTLMQSINTEELNYGNTNQLGLFKCLENLPRNQSNKHRCLLVFVNHIY